MSEERFRYDGALEKVYDEDTYNGETTESYGMFECCKIMNEQYKTITSFKDENLYKNFKLKSVDDLKN